MRNYGLLLMLLMPNVVAEGWAAAPVLKGGECRKIVLTGEAVEGQQWRAAIGEGWEFRLVPIAASGKGYSGWDLVVDTAQDGGYPDALLLGTPPYGSLNEREIGTTYGMRAQDAIAWTPRRFRFLTSAGELARSRAFFKIVTSGKEESAGAKAKAEGALLKIIEGASRGEFAVLGARLVAGSGDPPGFAEQWASHLQMVPHTLAQAVGPQSGIKSSRGDLQWIRFSASLWLPGRWKIPVSVYSKAAKCAQ